MSVSQGTLTMSESKVSAEGRRRISRGRDSAFGRLARSSSTDMTIAQTMKVLKERGLNVSQDPSQLPAWYMIDSRTSRHISKWDFTLVLALVVVALLTPFEVAFLPQAQGVNGLFWVNRVLDLIFAIDIVVVCFRIVAVTSHVEGMRWIVTPKELFQRYNKSGWFFIDTFTLIVSMMDIVTPLLSHGDAEVFRKFKVCAPTPPTQLHYSHAKFGESTSSRVSAPLSTLGTHPTHLGAGAARHAGGTPGAARQAPFRVTLSPGARDAAVGGPWLLKTQPNSPPSQCLISPIEPPPMPDPHQIGYGTMMLIKVTVQMIVYCHWFACLWALQTQFSETSLTETRAPMPTLAPPSPTLATSLLEP